jgi:hypothetical protein
MDCRAIKGGMALEVQISAQGILNMKREYGTAIYGENSGDIVSEESDSVTIHEGPLGIKVISRECPNNGQMLVLMKPLERASGRP